MKNYGNPHRPQMKTAKTRDVRVKNYPIYTGGHRSPRSLPRQRHPIPTPDELIALVDLVD